MMDTPVDAIHHHSVDPLVGERELGKEQSSVMPSEIEKERLVMTVVCVIH